jgi:imidazolonepropionase-like amidohydrolase
MREFIRQILLITSLITLVAANHASATESVVIRNARIFDGETDGLSQPTSLYVENGIIRQIADTVTAPDGARIIDAEERVVMPGLINAHAHVMLQLNVFDSLTSDEYYFAYYATVAAKSLLDNGFTTVRDMSGDTFSLKKAIDRGLIPGPRIFPSGAMISQTSGHSDHRTSEANSRLLDTGSRSNLEKVGMTIVADGRPEVLQAARENLRRGATQIKIAVGGGISSYADPLDVTQYTEDEIRAAVEAAESWGTYVAAHVYNSKGVRRAIDLGVKSIEHANLIDRDTLKLMQEKGVWLSPQVMIFEQKINGFNEDQLAKQRQAAEGLDALMRHAADLDYRNIVFGEDMVTSLEGLNRINQELVRRRQWFSPLQILRQATSRAGELCMLSGPRNPYGTVGVIKEGALADLLIVEGNPLEDISVLAAPKENLRLIMKGGEVYKNTL